MGSDRLGAALPLPDGSVPGFPDVKCKHLTAGDGFVKMADGKHQYIFGFNDVTAVPANQVIDQGLLAANFPAPTIAVDEGDQLPEPRNVMMVVPTSTPTQSTSTASAGGIDLRRRAREPAAIRQVRRSRTTA
jgi:hypothetical protein